MGEVLWALEYGFADVVQLACPFLGDELVVCATFGTFRILLFEWDWVGGVRLMQKFAAGMVALRKVWDSPLLRNLPSF